MFADYKSSIVADYEQKKASNVLPLRLVQPTPANLRKECLAVYEERYLKKDEKALREFFGPVPDTSTRLETIDGHDINKFRPLVKFLKEPSGSPEDKNIELLAWLIDFEPRPFELGRKYDLQNPKTPKNELVNNHDETQVDNDEQAFPLDHPNNPPELMPPEPEKPPTSSDHPSPQPAARKRRKMVAILAILFLALVSTCIYWSLTNKTSITNTPVPPAYKHRTADQQIPENQKPANPTAAALDSEKTNNLKKITNWDTLTLGSIRNVWYVKYHGNIELYTSPGFYPADQRLRLLPLTKYMYDKYIIPKQQHPVTSPN
jgi:hypothetical protein